MILVVQLRQDITEAHEQQCIQKRLTGGQSIKFVSIFDTSVDFAHPAKLLHNVNKVIIGGSAGLSMALGHEDNDYQKVTSIGKTIEPLCRYVLDTDFPTLAACYGHQLLGTFSGVTVEYDTDQSETGVFEITLTPEGEMDPMFESVPQRFLAIEGHQDSLISVPTNATLLARSERCLAQALRYGNNVYSTQFHSELDEKDLIYRVNLFPQYRTHTRGDSMHIAPSPFSVVPLVNFLKK